MQFSIFVAFQELFGSKIVLFEDFKVFFWYLTLKYDFSIDLVIGLCVISIDVLFF